MNALTFPRLSRDELKTALTDAERGCRHCEGRDYCSTCEALINGILSELEMRWDPDADPSDDNDAAYDAQVDDSLGGGR